MCLGIPGKVIEWQQRQVPFACAMVEFGTLRRSVNMACVPEAEPGDYVIVHAGVAIARIEPQEARRTLMYLEQLGEFPPRDEPNVEEVSDEVPR